MDAEEYIEQYGAALSDADKRYIRAFGAPQFTPGPANRPTTPNPHIAPYSRAAHDGGAASTTVEPPHET